MNEKESILIQQRIRHLKTGIKTKAEHEPKSILTGKTPEIDKKIYQDTKKINKQKTALKNLISKRNKLTVLSSKLEPEAAKVIESDYLEDLAPTYKQEILNRKIIWQADINNKPQIAFLQATEEEVLYSGSRGSGKTDALIADPLRYITNPNFKGLIIRKSMKRLREVMSRARKMYLQAVPGTRWKEQEKMFVFPSGATLEFGYCDTEADLDQYIGQEYIWLGIDELTQYPNDTIIETLKQSLRTTDKTLPRTIRCTCNPGGPGHRWVKERFVNLGPQNTRITIKIDTAAGTRQITRKWIHSTTSDNSILVENDPNYLVSLHAIQNETLRKQWLYGDWDAAEGIAFSEFNRQVHVIKPFNIPNNWLKFRACDWGYSSLAVCLWFAVDYDNNVYVYREMVENGNKAPRKLTATEFANKVLTKEYQERIRYGVLDCSTWSDRGQNGPSIAEEMIGRGCQWRMSDGSKGSRIAGKMQIHQYLSINEITGKPRLFIFDNCREIIDELSSLPLDENNPEDVDTEAQDHAYDALRYGLMSRPLIASDYMWRSDNGSNGSNAGIVVSSTFGY
jgi:PBSX family phage terminase large subunit